MISTKSSQHSSPPHKPPAPDQTTQELIKIKAQAEEYLNGWKRALADFDNYKKDETQRTGERLSYLACEFLRELLSISDHFDEGLKHVPDDQKSSAWYQGLTHIDKMFRNFLERNGIEKMKSIGNPFDPTIHDAVEIRHDPNENDDIILTELQPGYVYQKRLLRPAKVVVNKHKLKEHEKARPPDMTTRVDDTASH